MLKVVYTKAAYHFESFGEAHHHSMEAILSVRFVDNYRASIAVPCRLGYCLFPVQTRLDLKTNYAVLV